MKFDDIIVHVGQFGHYQRRICALICLSAIVIGLQTFATVFTMAVPRHRCAMPSWPGDTYEAQSPAHTDAIKSAIPPGEDGEAWSSCFLYAWRENSESNISYPLGDFAADKNPSGLNRTLTTTACSRWIYDTSAYQRTLVSEFNMVCERRLHRSHGQMFFMLGCLFGTLIMGPPADHFGRRKMTLVIILVQLAANLAIAFTPNFAFLCFFMFMLGSGMAAFYVVLFVTGMEFVGPKKRVYAGYLIVIFFGVGVVALVGGAYFIHHWQHLQLVLTLFTIVYIGFFWQVPESPRWLITRGRYREAEVILREAAKVNKREIPAKAFDWEDIETDDPAQEPMWHILKYPRLVVRTLVIYWNWMVCSMTYYGISLNVADLAGNIYFNMLLYGLVEILSVALCLLLLDRIGRRRLHLLWMFVAGISCTLSPFPTLYLGSAYQWLNITLAVLGKAGASAAFATIWLFTAELFATVVRNSGVSSSSLCAKTGGVIAPYIANLSFTLGGKLGKMLPLLIFGVASLVAGMLALLLPETSHANLPDTLMEANLLGKTRDKKTTQPKHGDVQKERQTLTCQSPAQPLHCVCSLQRNDGDRSQDDSTHCLGCIIYDNNNR